MGNGTYSPEFKLQVVLEALQSDGTDAEVARACDIHPVTLSNWKRKLKENGSKAFGGDDELKKKKDKIAKLEPTFRTRLGRTRSIKFFVSMAQNSKNSGMSLFHV